MRAIPVFQTYGHLDNKEPHLQQLYGVLVKESSIADDSEGEDSDIQSLKWLHQSHKEEDELTVVLLHYNELARRFLLKKCYRSVIALYKALTD